MLLLGKHFILYQYLLKLVTFIKYAYFVRYNEYAVKFCTYLILPFHKKCISYLEYSTITKNHIYS